MRERRRTPGRHDAFALRVSLRHIEPAIWRRIRVPAAVSLAALHEILQVSFGWQNTHLHDFTVEGLQFATPHVEDEIFVIDERATPLGAIAREGSTFLYRYDFGDDWEHDLFAERLLDGGGNPSIACLAGERAGPPDDSGGGPGYQRMLEILADPKHEEHADIRDWIGKRFDAEAFDVGALNKKLATLARRLARAR